MDTQIRINLHPDDKRRLAKALSSPNEIQLVIYKDNSFGIRELNEHKAVQNVWPLPDSIVW